MIRVYDANEKLFNNNGIKGIQPLFAEITKIDNSDYYVELEDILDNLEYYQKGLIVRIPTPWGEQGFRCDNPIIKNNRISCKAWHLFYDSKNYIINSAFATNKDCNYALDHYNSKTDVTSPFKVSSDISTSESSVAVRKSLFEVFNDLLNVYDGHLVRDNFNVAINKTIGEDRGVVLAYNKNITDIKVEENWENVCTKILPYAEVNDTVITLGEGDEAYVEANDNPYDIPYTKVVEFKYEEKEGEPVLTSKEDWDAWLRKKAYEYLDANKHPQVNYNISAKLDNVSDVGDTVWIKHPKIFRAEEYLKTWVLSIKYDAIAEKYTSIEFGNFKKSIKNLVDEVASVVKADIDVKTANNNAFLTAELEGATSAINSVLSGSYVINSGNEILIVDKIPKEEALYCLKINRAGIGFSNTGIYGTFNSAWTIDGTLNMQAINVINLTASLIKGGTLKLGATNNTSGTFELYDNSNKLMALMDKEGLTVYAQNGDYVKLNAEVGFAGYNKNGTKIYWADGDVFRMKNAEVENEIKIAGKIKIVPVSTKDNVGVGFVAIN